MLAHAPQSAVCPLRGAGAGLASALVARDKKKTTLLFVAASVTAVLWLAGTVYALLAAMTLGATGPNHVPWAGVFAGIALTALIPFGLFVKAAMGLVERSPD